MPRRRPDPAKAQRLLDEAAQRAQSKAALARSIGVSAELLSRPLTITTVEMLEAFLDGKLEQAPRRSPGRPPETPRPDEDPALRYVRVRLLPAEAEKLRELADEIEPPGISSAVALALRAYLDRHPGPLPDPPPEPVRAADASARLPPALLRELDERGGPTHRKAHLRAAIVEWINGIDV